MAEVDKYHGEKPTYEGNFLSKVKIGDDYYNLKDKAARDIIDAIYEDYLISTDKSELLDEIAKKVAITDYNTKVAELVAADTALGNRIAVFEANGALDVAALKASLTGRLDVIEGEGEGSIKKAVADEADARYAAIAAAIAELDVIDAAEDGKYVSAVSEVDGKIQVTRTALPTAAEYTIVKQETPESGMASTYYLTKNNVQVGAKINIAKDQFLKEAHFYAKAEDVPAGVTPPAGQEFPALRLVFEVAEGKNDIWIAVKELVDTYTAGDAIDITNNEISVKVKANDPYIEIDANNQIATTGIDAAIAAAVAEETEDRAEADTALGGRLDVIEGADTVDGSIKKALKDAKAYTDAEVGAEETRATGVEGGLNTRLTTAEGAITGLDTRVTTAEGEIDALQSASHTHSNKAELDLIKSGDVALWNAEKGAKAAAQAAQADVDALEAKVTADEALISANTTAITKEAQDRATEDAKKVDKTQKIAGLDLADDISVAEMQDALGLEDLAYSDTASGTGTVAAATITGVKATGNISGTASISMDYTPTGATLTKGEYTPAGDIDVTLSGATFYKITSVGSMPTYVAESVTGGKATVIDTSKFNGGAVATFTEGAFTPATLTYAASDEFVKEGLKAEVGTGADAECLIFSAVTNKGTASVISAFDGGSKASDTFDGGSVASLGTGFYTAGTDVSYTASQWTDGVTPTMESNTVAVATKSFTGTKVTDYVTGVTYDRADTSTGTVTANNVSLDVGAINVPAQTINVTVTPDAQ